MSKGNQFYYVYMISRPDGRPCYIGKGKGSRWRKHKFNSTNPHLANIYRKAGGKLSRIKLIDGVSEKEAFGYEKKFIKIFGREEEGGTLVNLTDGGEGISGHKHSKKSLKKMSRAHKGKKYALGSRWSDEARKKQSLAKLGKKLSPEHRAKIGQANRKPKHPGHGAAVSAGKMGKKASEATKVALRAANRSREPEVRARISRATRTAMWRPEVRRRYLEGCRRQQMNKFFVG